MMWEQEELTVGSTLSQIKKGKGLSAELGLKPVGIAMGPWPVGDQTGFQVASELFRASLKKRRNNDTYVQFDSIQKIRLAYANVEQTSPWGMEQNLLMKGPHGRSFGSTSAATDSISFRLFMIGCEKRMVRLVIQELGFTVDVVKEIVSGWD